MKATQLAEALAEQPNVKPKRTVTYVCPVCYASLERQELVGSMIVMNVEEGNLPDAVNTIVTKHGVNQLCVYWSEEEQCWKVSFPHNDRGCDGPYEQDD